MAHLDLFILAFSHSDLETKAFPLHTFNPLNRHQAQEALLQASSSFPISPSQP
jgi:hypothetical protein